MAKVWTINEILSPNFNYNLVKADDTLDYQGNIYPFNGEIFTLDAPKAKSNPLQSGYEITKTTFGQPMARSTVDNALAGTQKVDSDFAAAEKEKARINREEIQKRAQEDAQKSYQISQQDSRVEADKDAAAKAASQFKQQMSQQSAAAGGGAAVLASMNVQDPTQSLQQLRQRADEQRLIGTRQQEGAESAALSAVTSLQEAEDVNRKERDLTRKNLASDALSNPQKNPADSDDTELNVPQQIKSVALATNNDDSSKAIEELNKLISSSGLASQVDSDQEAVQNRTISYHDTEYAIKDIQKAIQLLSQTPSDKRIKNILTAINRRF